MERKSLRNLVQYRDLPEEEFEEIWQAHRAEAEEKQEKESKYLKRFSNKLEEFEKDYDISDLKYNDKQMLNSLIEGLLSLEDLEEHSRKIREKTHLSEDDIEDLRKITVVISKQRSDISKIQQDLRIVRRGRESEKDLSVLSYIENLKEKASQYYKKRLSYIYCPECGQLISAVWFLHPDEDNVLKLTCGRTLREDGGEGFDEEVCGHTFQVTSKALLKNKNKNLKDKL